ncbi:protein RRP5 homolog [Saccopteryx leptura]|uniref:protein RRP5 homolog n=1 Tax=Saccopteryx leptura TaxID=249018 RepID=UPI00339C5CCF
MGRVVKVTPRKGLTVSFPSGRIGTVSVFHVSDSYSETPLEDFTPQQIDKPRNKNKIPDPEVNSIQDVQEGQLLRGYVESVQSQGVLLGLGPSVVGLARHPHVSQYKKSKKALYNSHLPEGKLLTAKVLRVKHRKKLVELSFLPGDTGKPDVFPASLGLPILEQEERRIEAEGRASKRQEKEKRNRKGPEEAQLPSRGKKEPQKPPGKKQGKRPCPESGRKQDRGNKKQEEAAPVEDDSGVVYYLEGEEEMEEKSVLAKRGAGEAERVGGSAEPGEHVRLSGVTDQGLRAGRVVQ